MTIPRIPSYPMPRAESFPANKAPWQVDWQRSALLVHDMQRYFLSFYGDDSPLRRELIDAVARLLRLCRAKGLRIIYTAQPVHQSPEDRGLLSELWGPGIDNAPELKDIAFEIGPEDGDVVLDKWRYSAFERSPLAELLQEWGKDQLLICGVYGHIGCLMTAAAAFMRDIKPFLVGDAIADFSLEDHMAALRYTATRCGNVVSMRELTRHDL